MTDQASGSPQTVDYAALVKGARAGDKAAFTALYEATHKEIFRTIRAMVRTEDQALDIQQDAYVQAFTHLEQLTAPERITTISGPCGRSPGSFPSIWAL